MRRRWRRREKEVAESSSGSSRSRSSGRINRKLRPRSSGSGSGLSGKAGRCGLLAGRRVAVAGLPFVRLQRLPHCDEVWCGRRQHPCLMRCGKYGVRGGGGGGSEGGTAAGWCEPSKGGSPRQHPVAPHRNARRAPGFQALRQTRVTGRLTRISGRPLKAAGEGVRNSRRLTWISRRPTQISPGPTRGEARNPSRAG